jgi:hypothetical protein
MRGLQPATSRVKGRSRSPATLRPGPPGPRLPQRAKRLAHRLPIPRRPGHSLVGGTARAGPPRPSPAAAPVARHDPPLDRTRAAAAPCGTGYDRLRHSHIVSSTTASQQVASSNPDSHPGGQARSAHADRATARAMRPAAHSGKKIAALRLPRPSISEGAPADPAPTARKGGQLRSLHAPLADLQAEGEGFEPSRDLTAPNGFRDLYVTVLETLPVGLKLSALGCPAADRCPEARLLLPREAVAQIRPRRQPLEPAARAGAAR